jgi:hypothetical protein
LADREAKAGNDLAFRQWRQACRPSAHLLVNTQSFENVLREPDSWGYTAVSAHEITVMDEK